MYENKEKIEKVILFAVDLDNGEQVPANLDELEELVATAGAETLGRMIQNKDSIEKATYLGTGKVEELRDMVERLGATGVVCDDELSPIQMKNLEQELDTKVMDRTMVILDIFAKHATTREGKLQVELAQLKYRSNRLIGMGQVLSRLGGGIGTRGPGEKKLEVDRRLIRERISKLSADLKDDIAHREVMRKQRLNSHIPIVSIVGYTNAGKSTLLNHMTQAGVLEEDKLFATLDPTARKLSLPNGQSIMLIDTVGFISRLPHQLVDAFRSTLEEATYADVILNVCDASSIHCYENLEVTHKILTSLFPDEKIDVPVITVFNKCDITHSPSTIAFPFADAKTSVKISAKTGEGLENLLLSIQEALPQTKKRLKMLIPFSKGSIIADIRQDGVIHSEEYTPDGTLIDATVDIIYLEKNKHNIDIINE